MKNFLKNFGIYGSAGAGASLANSAGLNSEDSYLNKSQEEVQQDAARMGVFSGVAGGIGSLLSKNEVASDAFLKNKKILSLLRKAAIPAYGASLGALYSLGKNRAITEDEDYSNVDPELVGKTSFGVTGSYFGSKFGRTPLGKIIAAGGGALLGIGSYESLKNKLNEYKQKTSRGYENSFSPDLKNYDRNSEEYTYI